LFVAALGVASFAGWCDGKSPTDPGDEPNFANRKTAPLVTDCFSNEVLPGRLVTLDTRADIESFITDENGLGDIKPMDYPDGFFDRQPWEIPFRYTSATGCPVSPCQGGVYSDQQGLARLLWASDPRGGNYVRAELCLQP
jgi:hypothetical protein